MSSGRVLVAEIPDGAGGTLHVFREAGKEGRPRLRLSRFPGGSDKDPRFGPAAAIKLIGCLSDFAYQPQGGGTPEGKEKV